MADPAQASNRMLSAQMRLLVLAAALLCSSALNAACPDPSVSRLEVRTVQLTELAQLLNEAATNPDPLDPTEVAVLKFGLYERWIGAYANDGLLSWVGVNFGTGEIFRVKGYAGPWLSRLPAPDAMQQAATLRRRSRPIELAEVVTVHAMTPQELQGLVCLVNDFYKVPPYLPSNNQPPPIKTDSLSEVYVIKLPNATSSLDATSPEALARRSRIFEYIRTTFDSSRRSRS